MKSALHASLYKVLSIHSKTKWLLLLVQQTSRAKACLGLGIVSCCVNLIAYLIHGYAWAFLVLSDLHC